MKKQALAASLGLLGAVLWLGAPPALGQLPSVPTAAIPDARFAGLQWTFVRIRYSAWTMPPRGGYSMYDEPWYIDAPAAEWNLSRRVRSATSIQVNDPINLTIDVALRRRRERFHSAAGASMYHGSSYIPKPDRGG